MSYITTTQMENVLVATLDQPGEKVNKLDEKLISEFTDLMEEAADPMVRGIILVSGKENNFIAGADVEMLLNKEAPDEIEELSRRGNSLLMQLERFEKPVVAAIHGSCLGGGLEVAMACHYRVASDHPETVMGQPEVKLGLLPGGGGTQRLPRLIGLQNALTYMLTGKNIYPRKALGMGLVDELTHRDALMSAALAAVDELEHHPVNRKDKRGWLSRLAEGTRIARGIIYSQARKRAEKESRGNYPAPRKIIDCVEEGYENGIEMGLSLESKLFGELAATPESRALVRLFLDMQRARRNPGRERVRPVGKIGVLGAGLMGSGIADVSANNGIRVLLKDQNAEQAGSGKRSIWESLNRKSKKGIISTFERDRITSQVTATGSYDGFENVDMVIEAVFEDPDLKRSIIREVEQVIPDRAIFASNTSSIPISRLAEASERPEQVVGMHYFSPVPKMPLVEIIKTDRTADWVTATAREVGIRQGKHVIVVSDGPGFYTTRILAPFMNEALELLKEGIAIEEMDRIMKDFGFPVGPAALFDEVGIDVAAHITRVLNPLFEERGVHTGDKLQDLADAGFKGRKNRRGFYSYSDDSKKKKEPNAEIYRFFGGPKRGSFAADEVQDRMALAMVNEAVWCLQDEILDSPADGDLGAILGLGFPPFLGGPFRYIDRIGAGAVVEKMNRLSDSEGPRFRPAPLLEEQAESGKRFHPGSRQWQSTIR